MPEPAGLRTGPGGIFLGSCAPRTRRPARRLAASTSPTRRLIVTATGPRRDRLALRWLGKRGEVRDFTYAELSQLTNRFANVLRGLGVAKGERVFVLAGRIPELYIAALGTLEERECLLPALLGVRPRADSPADRHRRRPGARHHSRALQAKGGGAASFAARTSARTSGRQPRGDLARFPAPATFSN